MSSLPALWATGAAMSAGPCILSAVWWKAPCGVSQLRSAAKGRQHCRVNIPCHSKVSLKFPEKSLLLKKYRTFGWSRYPLRACCGVSTIHVWSPIQLRWLVETCLRRFCPTSRPWLMEEFQLHLVQEGFFSQDSWEIQLLITFNNSPHVWLQIGSLWLNSEEGLIWSSHSASLLLCFVHCFGNWCKGQDFYWSKLLELNTSDVTYVNHFGAIIIAFTRTCGGEGAYKHEQSHTGKDTHVTCITWYILIWFIFKYKYRKTTYSSSPPWSTGCSTDSKSPVFAALRKRHVRRSHPGAAGPWAAQLPSMVPVANWVNINLSNNQGFFVGFYGVL